MKKEKKKALKCVKIEKMSATEITIDLSFFMRMQLCKTVWCGDKNRPKSIQGYVIM